MTLRSRWLAALLAAEVVSTTGSAMTYLALPWFVLVTTGSATRTSLVVAAELAGVVGAPAVLIVGAATFVASLALVGLFVPPRRAVAVEEEGAGGLLAGIKFLLRDPLLRVWSIGMIVIDSSWQALFLAFPVLAYSHFGRDAKVAGWLFASWGLGALIGNAAAYRLANRDPLLMTSAGMLVEALPLWLLAVSLPVTGSGGVSLAAGIMKRPANPSLH